MSVTRFYHIDTNGKFIKTPTWEEAFALSKSGGYIWLSYCDPAIEDLSVLSEPFSLHSLSIEDCLDDIQIPKIDEFPDNTFILFNDFKYIDKNLTIEEVNIFIGKNYLITIHRSALEEKKIAENILTFVQKNPTNIKKGPAFLMHVFIDLIVDKKFIAIEAMEDELDKAEDALISNLSDFSLNDLQHLRRDLLAIRKSLFHEREVLIKICRKDSPFIADSAIFHFRDIYDHLANFFELTETFREIVTSLMEMYISILNNQMTKTANQTNFIIRRLTFITTVFMPLSLLAGIGGMSEFSMMTDPSRWRITYPLFIIAMIVIGLLSYYLLKRLEKKDKNKDIIF